MSLDDLVSFAALTVDAMLITSADTVVDRIAVQAFFETAFPRIAPNAVPAVEHDHLYAPIVLTIRDSTEPDRILAASLSCRTNETAGALSLPTGALPLVESARKVAHMHSNLDLIATEPAARGAGFASALLTETETRLAQTGVRVWFGCVTEDLDAEPLRRFYRRHGFTVLDDGDRLPPLLGFPGWNAGKDDVRFRFYKPIAKQR